MNWRWVEEGDGYVGRLQPPGQPLGVGLPSGLQCLVPYPYRDPLSPTLFGLFIEVLEQYIKRAVGSQWQGRVPDLLGTTVGVRDQALQPTGKPNPQWLPMGLQPPYVPVPFLNPPPVHWW